MSVDKTERRAVMLGQVPLAATDFELTRVAGALPADLVRRAKPPRKRVAKRKAKRTIARKKVAKKKPAKKRPARRSKSKRPRRR